MAIYSFLDRKIPSWSTIRRIKSAKITPIYSALTIIVPIYASMQVLVQDSLGVKIGPPANLVALYFSALSVFVAGTIFELTCPRVIREYKTKYEFVDSCIKFEDMISNYVTNAGARYESILEDIVKRTEDSDKKNSDEKILKDLVEQLVFAQLHHEGPAQLESHWITRNEEDGMASRRAIMFFYALAFLLASYVTLYSAPSNVIMAFLG